MNGVPLELFHLSFKNAPISNENRQLLSYLGFSLNVNCPNTLNEWSDFVRRVRVTFHTSNVTKDFESCPCQHTLPYINMNYVQIVLKLLFSISSTSCDVLNDRFQLVWKSGENNEIVAIDWEELDVVESFISMCVTCGFKKGCR